MCSNIASFCCCIMTWPDPRPSTCSQHVGSARPAALTSFSAAMASPVDRLTCSVTRPRTVRIGATRANSAVSWSSGWLLDCWDVEKEMSLCLADMSRSQKLVSTIHRIHDKRKYQDPRSIGSHGKITQSGSRSYNKTKIQDPGSPFHRKNHDSGSSGSHDET